MTYKGRLVGGLGKILSHDSLCSFLNPGADGGGLSLGQKNTRDGLHWGFSLVFFCLACPQPWLWLSPLN